MSLCSQLLKKTKLSKRQSLIAATLVASISAVAAAASAIAIIATPSRADACRDCPFPMKIAEDRWLMPNRQLEVQIIEIDFGRFTETNITVMSAATHEILAKGSIRQRKGRKTVSVNLVDSEGQPAHAEIRWMDEDREKVQINLVCGGECAFSQLLR